ncbi:nucleotide exchange factor GrpE [Saccharothrix sp. NRRL B-16314]|uniref:nucleotide exchange factor GrpE n=1 Tax=Saccharothrix sp. NRRL B-16314 TaxID=1463825 RepID=UPI0005259F32|nr:nucleotide exchange factor GrpE [Saccharothrix sp. NRRL B-16314]
MTQPEEQPHVVVRDRRRVDPDTGEMRTPSPEDTPVESDAQSGAESGAEPETESVSGSLSEPGEAPGPAGGGKHSAPDLAEQAVADDPSVELKSQLDERTADLQRLTAEYANYRKRVDRDREVVINTAKAQVAGELLSVLDDIERAGAHGDLTGAFKAVADKLVGALHGTGLVPFGHEGEEFDPSVHEAVQHSTSPDVSGPTVTAVLRRGYRFGERVLRPALVAVTDHEPAAEPVVESAAQPVEEPADESAATSAEKSAEKSAEEQHQQG